MSFCVFFEFSTGLARPVHAPPGTLEAIFDHIGEVERVFGFEAIRYRDNTPMWRNTAIPADIPNEVACRVVSEHNAWVRQLWHDLSKWFHQPPDPFEVITPEDAQRFWHCLSMLEVPPERWTMEHRAEELGRLVEAMATGERDGVFYDAEPITRPQAEAVAMLLGGHMLEAAEWTADEYAETMDEDFEAMTRGDFRGGTFEAAPITREQAAEAIALFAQWLDGNDVRLALPKGRSDLARSDEGEYLWCERCGAIHEDDAPHEMINCPRGDRCSLVQDHLHDFEEVEEHYCHECVRCGGWVLKSEADRLGAGVIVGHHDDPSPGFYVVTERPGRLDGLINGVRPWFRGWDGWRRDADPELMPLDGVRRICGWPRSHWRGGRPHPEIGYDERAYLCPKCTRAVQTDIDAGREATWTTKPDGHYNYRGEVTEGASWGESYAKARGMVPCPACGGTGGVQKSERVKPYCWECNSCGSVNPREADQIRSRM